MQNGSFLFCKNAVKEKNIRKNRSDGAHVSDFGLKFTAVQLRDVLRIYSLDFSDLFVYPIALWSPPKKQLLWCNDTFQKASWLPVQ